MIMASDVKTNLRLPEELYEEIKRLAAAELRSVNQQMVALLREAVERRQPAEEREDRTREARIRQLEGRTPKLPDPDRE